MPPLVSHESGKKLLGSAQNQGQKSRVQQQRGFIRIYGPVASCLRRKRAFIAGVHKHLFGTSISTIVLLYTALTVSRRGSYGVFPKKLQKQIRVLYYYRNKFNCYGHTLISYVMLLKKSLPCYYTNGFTAKHIDIISTSRWMKPKIKRERNSCSFCREEAGLVGKTRQPTTSPLKRLAVLRFP